MKINPKKYAKICVCWRTPELLISRALKIPSNELASLGDTFTYNQVTFLNNRCTKRANVYRNKGLIINMSLDYAN